MPRTRPLERGEKGSPGSVGLCLPPTPAPQRNKDGRGRCWFITKPQTASEKIYCIGDKLVFVGILPGAVLMLLLWMGWSIWLNPTRHLDKPLWMITACIWIVFSIKQGTFLVFFCNQSTVVWVWLASALLNSYPYSISPLKLSSMDIRLEHHLLWLFSGAYIAFCGMWMRFSCGIAM